MGKIVKDNTPNKNSKSAGTSNENESGACEKIKKLCCSDATNGRIAATQFVNSQPSGIYQRIYRHYSQKNEGSTVLLLGNIPEEFFKTPGTERDNSESRKKIWSSDALKETMSPTCEELDYRREKSIGLNPLERYSKLFKCTKCQKNLKLSIEQNKKAPVHTCLGVLMCDRCRDYYEDGEFSLDSDGEDKYCRWCGEGGTIFTCSQCICGFCANCIKRHFSSKFFKTVQRDEDWLCFFCNPKPLWFQRYICSLAIQLSEEADALPQQKQEQPQISPKVTVKEQEEPQISPKVTVKEQEESQISPKVTVKEQEEPQISPKVTVKEQEEPQISPKVTVKEQEEPQISPKVTIKEQEEPQISPRVTVNEQKNDVSMCNSRAKRKRLYSSSSSSDETDCETSRSPLKKCKLTSNPLKSLMKDMEKESPKNVKSRALFELQKLLKLSEYQMNFGVNWCHDTLKKISKSDYKLTEEGLLDECKKIKWFLSVLSTYLVQFCNSADSIEKSLCKDNEKKISGTPEKDQSPYLTILQFLDFINKQIKTFVEKDISFSDILESSVYDDGKVIGLKKKDSLKNKKVDPHTMELDLTNEDSESNESKEEINEDDISRGEASVEIGSDQNNEGSFLESGDSCTPRTTHKDNNPEHSDSAQDIQKLLSILENA